MIKNIQMPSKREALTVTVIMALFLLLTGIFIGL
ncbi:inositol phosphorylceramide synthase, partial [Escherichia coli]|nr:inositol phosphorylceramide synthase [Escherichia coli]